MSDRMDTQNKPSKKTKCRVFREYILQEDVGHEQDRISSCSCRTGRYFKERCEKALKAFVDVVTEEMKKVKKFS